MYYEILNYSKILVYDDKSWQLKEVSEVLIKKLNILKKYNIHIQHAENGEEHRILNSNYRADGYCVKTNTIYEFHGCFYHGCKKCFNENNMNTLLNKLYKTLYDSTLEREKYILSMG